MSSFYETESEIWAHLDQFTEMRFASFLSGGCTKGQLISEQIYGVLNFPKMQRN